MTILYAYDQTDLYSVNLNFWYGTFYDDDEFNNDANEDGYEDNYHLYTTTNETLSLYGYDFGRNGDGDMVRGTIQSLTQWAWDGVSAWDARWHWTGWNIPTVDFFNAGQTGSTDDDMALIEHVMSGVDTLNLSEFDDNMRGFDGNDVLNGFRGNDVLRGDDGRDKLVGAAGNDKLYGGTNRDKLYGGPGDDLLGGGGANDILSGGSGTDVMTGGAASDTFQFRTGDETDTITDFNANGLASDKIDLSAAIPIASWSDLRDNHMTQVGSDVVIDAFFGDVLTLQNVDLADLNKVDFIF